MTARPQPKCCRRLAGSDPSTILPRVLHLPPSSYQDFGNDSTSLFLCFSRKPLKAANLMQEEQGEQAPPQNPDNPCFTLANVPGPSGTSTRTEWLAHSKKKTCDVCKHPYSFTKVLPSNRFRNFVRSPRSSSGDRVACSTALVDDMDLEDVLCVGQFCVSTSSPIPLTLIHAPVSAWWISAVKRDAPDVDFYPATVLNNPAVNATSTNTTDAQPSGSPSLFSHPLYRAISSDIFSGQIIASIIVLTFVAIFLLREWITQNARPGVFEDGDAGVEPGADALPAFPELPPPQRPVHLAPPALPRPPSPPPIVAELVHERAIPIRDDRFVPRDDVPFQARTKKPRTRGDVHASEDSQEAGPSHVGKGKQRAHTTAREGRRSLRRRRIGRRTRMFDGDESFDESMGLHDDKNFRRLRYVAHRAGDFDDELRRRNGSSSMSEPEKWPPERNHKRPRDPNRLPAFSEFTFTYPSRPLPTGMGVLPRRQVYPFARSLSRRDLDSDDDSDERERTPTRPSTPILGASPSGSYDLIDAEDFEAPTSPVQASPSAAGLRRPRLPFMTLPPSPDPSISGEVVQGATPLASPSLATYRAPEELDADGGGDRDYFPHDYDPDAPLPPLLDLGPTKEEHAQYFRDPSEDDTDFDTDEEEARARVHQGVGAQGVRAQEMAEMADEELDVDDEGDVDMDDLQWTDDDPLHEDDDERRGGGRSGRRADQRGVPWTVPWR
uniref:RING-type E3 ubiquitin transferase n=1 Tax=Ganoderma boninense TaxID=34458 RepID=A0A5K1K075_9APHY|nr:Transcriptional repressor rco-1 [Ganoderma boninense]